MISEQQLKKWSSAPSETEMRRIKSTKDQIECFLKRHLDIDEIKKNYNLSTFEYDVYLQGSYANSTNISFNSDVDIVIEFKSEYYYSIKKLSLSDSNIFHSKGSGIASSYNFIQFKKDIYNLFDMYYDNVKYNPKCIELPGNINRVDADLVPCFTFKDFLSYSQFGLPRFNQGIKFWNTQTNLSIINYPKIHKDNCIDKNKITNTKFKSCVRVFKNFKKQLVDNGVINDKIAPSYFIENVIYNIPNSYFNGTYSQMVGNIFVYLLKDNKNWDGFVCANGIDKLFSNATWNVGDAEVFLGKAFDLFFEG